MRLLVDEELLALVRHQAAVADLPVPREWFGPDSPVQPASLDLHVGEIFIPGMRSSAPGGHDDPEDAVVLRTGHTIVVTTLETLNLPPNVCGVGFPPSRVSELGILMTNPGHVDPGYSGRMRFAVINVGKADYSLRRGDAIITLLLFQLDRAPKQDWNQRHPITKPSRPDQSRVNCLSHDFVDMESRVRTLTLKTAVYASAMSAVLGAVISVFLTLGANYLVDRTSRLHEMQNDISRINAEIETMKHNSVPSNTPPTVTHSAASANQGK